MQFTEGGLLNGRLRYLQPAAGFRSGIEPVLLAAAIPARPGERVLEAGTGAGAALLCLAHRVPGLTGTGIEIDPALAGLATRNLAINRIAGIVVATGDLLTLPIQAGFDHGFANPPYHPQGGTGSAEPRRERAKRAAPGLPAAWINALAIALRDRGTLTLVLPAGAVAEALAAAGHAGCGSPSLLPLWPAAGRAAKLVLLRWIRGGRAPLRLLPGLVLHAGGGFTPAAEAVLRDAMALPI